MDSASSRTGIAAGQLEHPLLRLQLAGRSGVFDHLFGDVIFLGKSWIELRQFGQGTAVQIAGQSSRTLAIGVSSQG